MSPVSRTLVLAGCTLELTTKRTPTRPVIAGNWKMNGDAAAIAGARRLAVQLAASPPRARVALCPPTSLIHRLAQAVAGTPLLVGGQDCRAEAQGAFTGDESAEMLLDAGARMVILGHSERRTLHGEDDALVAAKVLGALRAGLEPIICVGETLDQRRTGRAIEVVRAQIRVSLPPELKGNAFCVAYEPVWAIGSGLIPTLDDIETIHGVIRADLLDMFGAAGAEVAILYGGSVKPSNAAQILGGREVGGVLVGGASLDSETFMEIIAAA